MFRLSDTEIYLMHIIWSNFPITSFDIIDYIQIDKEISKNTVRTLLARMVEKEAIYISHKIRKNIYI